MIGQTLEHIKNMIKLIESTPIIYGDNIQLLYSYGIVSYDYSKHQAIEQLIHDADLAMYQHKRRKI